MTAAAVRARINIRFDRNELAGAFGDIGTDLPLVAGMILAAGLDAAGVLILFGVMQWLTAFRYGIPMPVQPLKAMAVIVITQHIAGPVLYGAGLAIGATMLLLSVTGALSGLARAIPKAVVRGLQLGLGLQLALLALREYIPAAGRPGLMLAAVALVVTLVLLGNRRFPPALLVIAMGVAYAFAYDVDASQLAAGVGFSLPAPRVPGLHAIVAGFVLLALPQIPLSLGNSLLATRQVAADLFPERPVSVRQLGYTYAAMNLVSPWFGGVPVCHGSGGLAGHHTFGARTGGSLMIYGSLYVVGGLFFAGSFATLVRVFPFPVLGVLLLFEAFALMRLVRDQFAVRQNLAVTVITAALAAFLPYGYVIAMVAGTAIWYGTVRRAF
ncbi:MAG TPA: putative sulfate/molybdate transporter [Gemmatimonadaceae bacterium]|nr:putative sulfate/molybdate transporter [Gemmatimonadaceae bacterium]